MVVIDNEGRKYVCTSAYISEQVKARLALKWNSNRFTFVTATGLEPRTT